jgi:DNA replication protein DnaC
MNTDLTKQVEFPWTPAQLKMLAAIEGIVAANGICILCGTRGTGKTTVAQEVRRRVGFGIYELAQDYFEEVAMLVSGRLFKGVPEAKKYRDRRVKTSILVLDEIAHVSADPLGSRVIQDLIIRRHAAKKPTILITNQTKDTLTLDHSTLDRVNEGGAIFQPSWGSFRGQTK